MLARSRWGGIRFRGRIHFPGRSFGASILRPWRLVRRLLFRLVLVGATETQDFVASEESAATELERSESERTELDPLQLHHLMPDSGEESADLAVLPFAEDDFEQGGLSDRAEFANGINLEFSLVKLMSRAETLKFLTGRRSRDENAIDLANPETGMGELLGEETIIGDDDESLTALVEPADCKQAFGYGREDIDHAESTGGIVVGTEVSGGFIDGEIDFLFQFQSFPVELNLLGVGIDFDTESGDDFAIDFDSSGDDHLFASPAGTATCSGEYSLEANQAGVGSGNILARGSRLIGSRFPGS